MAPKNFSKNLINYFINIRKLRSGKGTGLADQIRKSAPETCAVKIVCDGNEVIIDQSTNESPCPRGNADSFKESSNISKAMQEEEEREEPTSCNCFGSKFA